MSKLEFEFEADETTTAETSIMAEWVCKVTDLIRLQTAEPAHSTQQSPKHHILNKTLAIL